MTTCVLTAALLSLATSQVRETQHAVHVELSDGVAVFEVHREFEGGFAPDGVDQELVGPRNGSVTGFQIRENGGSPVKGHLSSLREAQDVIQRSLEGPKRRGAVAAVLTLEGRSPLRLQTTPLFPRHTLAVDLEVVAPLRLQGDALVAPYRQDPTPERASRVISFGQPGELAPQLRVDPPAQVLQESVEARLELPPAPVHSLVGTGHSPDGRWITRVQVAAAHLSEAPAHAAVVVIIDGSASEAEIGIRGELKVAERFVRAFPRARFEFVVFQREARRITQGFVDGDAALKVLEDLTRALRPANGSNLGPALELATHLLAAEPEPKRVLVLTDGEIPNAFAPAAQPTGPGILNVGLVRVSWNWPALHFAYLDEPRPEHPLAVLATRTGGTIRSLGPKSAPLEVEQLVRPVCLEDSVIIADGARVASSRTLCEGGREDTIWWGAATAPKGVTLEGKLWASAHRYLLPLSAGMSKYLGALAIADPNAPLTPAQRHEWATTEHGLSDGLAFVALPARRVSSDAIAHGGAGGVVGVAIGDNAGDPPELNDDPAEGLALARLVQAAVGVHCSGAPDPTARVEVETTGPEIVSVQTVPASGSFASCANAVIWSQRLDPARFKVRHALYRIELAAPKRRP